jgi:hypothetical protein
MLVSAHSATYVVGSWHHRYWLLGNVDAKGKTFLINIGKTLPKEISISMGYVQINAVVPTLLDLSINGSSHYISTGQILERVVFGHEGLPTFIDETTPFSPHRFGDEEVLSVRVIKAGRVKLNKFHICNFCPCPVSHGHTVTGGHIRVASVNVNLAGTACTKESVSCQEGQDTISFDIQNVGAPTPFLTLSGK